MQGDAARLYRSRAKITHSIATGGLSGGAILWKMCAIDRKIQAPFHRNAMTYHKPLPPWIASVDLHDFDSAVLAASHGYPVLVDFWADWCSPCLVIAPVLERVIAEYDGAVRLAKLEVDAGENMKLAGHYRVRGFPTIILFSQGKEQGRFSGAHPAPYIRAFIEQHLPAV
jgi:thioredoxin 1